MTRFKKKKVNLDTITDVMSRYKIQPLSGYDLIRVNENFSGDGMEFQKFRAMENLKSFTHTHTSLEFGKSCEDLSSNHCASSIRDKWYC